MSTSPAKNLNGGPPTPTVKKIINSGTFGAGSVKPTGTKAPAQAAMTTKTTVPAPKKTTISPPTASKPTLASSTSAKPAPSATATVTARRASVVPTKPTAPSVKPSLSASVKPKPTTDSGSVRGSVASPTGSIGSARATPTATLSRPRASVSESVKKAPAASRPSIAGTIKPTGAAAKTTPVSRSSAAAPPIRAARTTSVSSIKEAKEDSFAVQELQIQLDEATRVLEQKISSVSDLEEQLAKVEASLAIVSEANEFQAATIKDLENAKAALQAQLQEKQNDLDNVQAQLDGLTSTLRTVQTQLEDAKSASLGQNDVVTHLQNQVEQLEAVLASSKEKIASLEENAAVGIEASLQAASIHEEALSEARSSYKAATEEIETLKAAHAKALQDSNAQIAELNEKITQTEFLEAQVAALKQEKEENATKLSELEIEILELKEIQDDLEDVRDRLKQQVIVLEDELANAAVASGLAKDDISKKEAGHAQTLDELRKVARYADVVSSLEDIKAQFSEALAAHDQSQQDLLDKEEKHAVKIVELEEASAETQAALLAEIEKITKELHSQEIIYNAKVDAVKAEHTKLLEEAFEKAKDEASSAHAQELQAFRASSNATIEEIKSANKIAFDTLKADHASSLESELNDLQKQINKLKLELKATQDDLLKAKASLEASRSAVNSLTKQRDAALAQANAPPTTYPEQADEIVRLRRELAFTKDDLAAATDMLNLTKSSMTQLSDNHSRELQEAAKTRADEVLKLRSSHDAEITKFVTQKSELLIQLSDLEGELLSAKAAFSAQQTASPKSSSNGPTQSASMITKEELTKLHEAHNLKLYDLQASHEKALKQMKEELNVALGRIDDLEQDVSRKDMEIQYMAQDQEESQETITRLKEDLEALNEKLQS
ncbi:hypothetical protein BDN70DRAFT_908060 [Pholiota conissans]|uniref:Uncharacterized protein n=1 Tax=Pholiota conissans TaxID=109636 RepID=A0A9P6CQB6_9AGAR|nr:hypothetical protein BDN70DRAFT_908060 [Pholiota conissans]